MYLGSLMLKPNYSELSKRKASLRESNPNHKGLAHATRKVCTLHTLKKISANKNLQTSNPNTHMFSCTSKLIISNQNGAIKIKTFLCK
jgi:hypothetical protein